MIEKLELEDFLCTKKGIMVFLHIENGQSRYTDLYRVVNLSPSTLNKYLKQMLGLRLTEIIECKEKPRGKKRVYQLTEKGKELIEPIEKIRLATQKIEEIIEELSNKG